MRARNGKTTRLCGSACGERRLRDEITPDALEIWIGISRLISRLTDGPAPPKTARRTTRRRLTGKAGV